MRNEVGRENSIFIHLTLVPYIGTSGELKTKPTQHSVKELREIGIQPDILLCRTNRLLTKDIKSKIALFCNVSEKEVITALDVHNIYEVPLVYHSEGLDDTIVNHLCLPEAPPDLSRWEQMIASDRNPIDSVQIETPGFMGFAHGYHHEKDGLGLNEEDDFLLALCFCDACLARAARAGVDGEAARRTVRHWIAEACERAMPAPQWPDFREQGLEVFAPHPEVLDYVRWRFEPVTSLAADLRAAVHPRTRVHVLDIGDGWLCGSDLAALARATDGIVFCAYDRHPAGVEDDLVAARALVGPDRFLGTGFRVFWPEMRGPHDFVARAEAARAAGVQEINFYNYGLIPAARLDWVRAGCDALAG